MRTGLTEFVENKWKESTLSQLAFLRDVLKVQPEDFGLQNMSKFTKGRLVQPPQGLVSALSRVYEISEEELLSMHRREIDSANNREEKVEGLKLISREDIKKRIDHEERRLKSAEENLQRLRKLLENYEVLESGLEVLGIGAAP